MFALNIFCLGVMRRLEVVCSHVAPEQRSAEANTAMPAQLVEELRAMRSVRAFNPRAWIDSKVDKLNEYMRKGSETREENFFFLFFSFLFFSFSFVCFVDRLAMFVVNSFVFALCILTAMFRAFWMRCECEWRNRLCRHVRFDD